MIKSALMALLEIISGNLVMMDFSSSSYISSGIGAFGRAYSVVIGVANNVCQPVAYTLLTIFLLLDLYEVTMHLYQQGGGGMAAPVAGIKTLLKLAFCKWGIDNSTSILTGIFDIASKMTARVTIGSGTDLTDYVTQMHAYVDTAEIGIFDGIADMVLLLLVVVITWLAIIGVTYVVLSRYVQLYFYLALSPIPMSFMADQHTMQMGIGFLKGFAGVALQAFVVSLSLRMFPLFAREISMAGGSFSNYCLQIAMLSIVLVGTVFASSQVAQRVFGG